jgi:hypothetical protein
MISEVDKYYAIQSYHSVVTETRQLGGKRLEVPLIKAAVGAVITDPFAGEGFHNDLSSLTEHSAILGLELGRRALELLGGLAVEGYGKGGIAGADSAQEHVVACITTVFGDAFRDAIGGGKAWISSASKMGGPGVQLDIPLAYKDEVYVRSHYDAITLTIPDGPKANEFVICVAVSSGPRPFNRVGGLTVADVVAAQA